MLAFLAVECPAITIEHSNTTNATGVYSDHTNITCLPGYQKEALCNETHDATSLAYMVSGESVFPYDLSCQDGMFDSMFQIGCNGFGEWSGLDNCKSKLS